MTEQSAGQRLAAALDAALEHASTEAGHRLIYDEREQLIIEQAVIAADRAERLRTRLDTEFAGRASADALIKLSAEARMCEKQAMDAIMRVQIGEGVAKSPRHQLAARARWDRPRPVA